ncbi:hypothetical protein CsatA_021796 [Cannabis sativa]
MEREIPVIFFDKETLKQGTDSWKWACKQVRLGFEEHGCLEVVFDKVAAQVHNSVFDATKDLFKLPVETLSRKTSDRLSVPYISNWSHNPLYESLGIDHSSTPQGVEKFTNIMWPQGNDHFRESVVSFSKLMTELFETVTKMLFESYGVERLHESVMKSTFHRLKLSKYRSPKEKETNLGLQPHTDKTFINIVHQHQVEGLQIKSNKDGHWLLDAKPSPNSFVVFAGDILRAWSNDRILPSEHRVIMKEGNKDRYVIALFTYIDGIIEVPEEMVDNDKYPLQYKPIDHMTFLQSYFEDQELQKAPCPIKFFFGL